MTGVCEVHRLVYRDTTPREVRYCSICDADLCEECRTRWGGRAVAALKRALGAGAN